MTCETVVCTDVCLILFCHLLTLETWFSACLKIHCSAKFVASWNLSCFEIHRLLKFVLCLENLGVLVWPLKSSCHKIRSSFSSSFWIPFWPGFDPCFCDKWIKSLGGFTSVIARTVVLIDQKSILYRFHFECYIRDDAQICSNFMTNPYKNWKASKNVQKLAESTKVFKSNSALILF